MKPIKSAPVDKAKLAVYRKRADECVNIADQAFRDSMWYGTCINAIHAAIALSDCLSIFLRGTRYAGSNHEEAIDFYGTLGLKKDGFQKSIQNFGKLISIKNMAEYSDKTLTEKDADAALTTLKRFREFVVSLLPKVARLSES